MNDEQRLRTVLEPKIDQMIAEVENLLKPAIEIAIRKSAANCLNEAKFDLKTDSLKITVNDILDKVIASHLLGDLVVRQ